jgi:hypothetical protein
VQRDGEDAGQRADAEGPDEDQREDDLGHGARRFQQAPRASESQRGAPRLRAAGKASSSPAAAPISVASAAICAVSNSSSAQASRPVEPEGEAALGGGPGEQRGPAQVGRDAAKVLADARQPGPERRRVELGHPAGQDEQRAEAAPATSEARRRVARAARKAASASATEEEAITRKPGAARRSRAARRAAPTA